MMSLGNNEDVLILIICHYCPASALQGRAGRAGRVVCGAGQLFACGKMPRRAGRASLQVFCILKKSQEDGRLDDLLAALSAEKCIIGIVNFYQAFTFDLITLIRTGGDHC